LELDPFGVEVWELHRYLIGLRRRHPWLHRATSTAARVDNRGYVYETRSGDDRLLVALNIDDEPLRLRLSKFGTAHAEVLAGSGAPAPEVVERVEVEPHGWRILRPA
jgi:hypothetical protein